MTKLKKTFAILFAILIASTMVLTSAHTPPWSIPTYAYIVVSPNPIGVGQTVNVNFWINAPPPTAAAQYGDRWSNLTVVITKPDGTQEKLGPFQSDTTGGTFTTYTPDTVGNYIFQSFFGGDVVKGLNQPIPGTISQNAFVNDTFLPSESAKYTLTVQEEQIPYEPAAPLPTEYWTRPIYGENNAWYSIAGNWLGQAASTFASTGMYNSLGNYNPFTSAPNTAHILWTKPVAFGGIIGGEYGYSETANYYSTSQYEPKFAPIIMQGILYYTLYPGSSTHPEGWNAVDLHTGEVIWNKAIYDEVLYCGQILNMITPNQYGALAYLWSIPTSAAGYMAAGQYMSMYDAMTGNFILKIQNTQRMTLVPDDNGDLIGYYVNASQGQRSLTMWNSTRCINVGAGGFYYGGGASPADNWMWRPPLNRTLDFEAGIQASWPIVTEIEGNSISLGLSSVSSGVALMTQASVAGSSFFQNGWIIEAGYDLETGQKLWGPVNRTQVVDSRVLYGSSSAGNDVWVEFDSAALQATGFNLRTGQKIWGPTKLPGANPYSSLGQNFVVAEGVVYTWTYGGDIYAIELETGKFLWEYHSRSGGYESPYGVQPLWTFTVGSIADGKLFVPEGHMYSPPLFHQAQQLAINITDGSIVWSIDAFDVTSAPAISDGIMTTLNAYDNQIYTWGKGPSKVTVSAPAVGVTTATPIVISGTVTDLSAGSKQDAVASNFPNGLPCISDENMTPFMEAVYMQQPMPNDITGVSVSIDVIDSNGNYRNIGTTTSDSAGKFSFTWKPDIEGDYKVIATFAGSESYYSAYDEAFFTVSEPESTASPVQQNTLPQTEMYIALSTVAIIIAIAIVGLLLLRRKP